MLATKLEVQNISTSWGAAQIRSGYFSLQLDVCNPGYPCFQTKKLAWNAGRDDMVGALRSLPGIGDFNVTFTQTTDLVNSAWVITFLSACDIPPLLIVGATMPVSATTVVGGQCNMIRTSNNTGLTFPYMNTFVVEEVQKLYLSCPSTSGCPFQLSFRGLWTPVLNTKGLTAMIIQNALQDLESVGSVTAAEIVAGSTYTISFYPTAGSTSAHLDNYGNLPLIEIHQSLSLTTPYVLRYNSSVTSLVQGYVPFSASVEAISVSAPFTTAVDEATIPGNNGLTTGIYEDTSAFIIQSRDQFSNRVYYGPVNEVQIIETVGGDSGGVSGLTGSFTISYNGHSVDVQAGASLLSMQAALQSLPTIGAVALSTNSVQDLTDLSCSVTLVRV